MRMGDDEAAERLQRQALEILEHAVNPNDPAVAQVLNNLGGILLDAGKTEQAEPLLERALEVREGAYGPDSPLVARVLNNLGNLQVRAGELKKATRFYDRSLAILERSLGPDHPETANVLEKLGDVLHREAEYEASRAQFERALAIYEQSLGSEHPAVANCLRALAQVSLDTGDTGAALDLALRADEIGREHLLLTARTLPERQALAYALARPAGQDLAYSVLAGQKAIDAIAASRVWHASIRSRALVLDEMRSRHRTLSQAEEPARRLARTSERLANLLVRGPGSGSTEQYRRLVLGAREDRDRAERALAEASLSFRRTKEATQYGFREVVAALPEKSALVAFVRYERRHAAGTVPSYMAMVLRGEGGAAAIPLGSEDDIEPLVARWQEEIAAARNRSPVLGRASDARYREVSERLRRVVWEPVAKQVGKSERVFVVPDGVLHVVNLATLADASGTYLIESAPPFHYLSTERDLVGAGARPAPGEGLLVAGGAAFGEESALPSSGNRTGCVDLDSLRFAALPGTVREIDTVASLWSSENPEGPEARISRLEGARATEDAFKQRSPGHRVLHLATHGFFVDECCETDSTERAASAEGTIRSLAPPARDEPAVLSGLALAGANLRHRPDLEGSDGILTAHEIASIDLAGVDWVVLSACDTGLGAIRAGEGVFGLRRAFQIAGAETLVMSLWPVEDASNRAWMRRLYEARLGGLGSAEAVHRAGLGVLRARRRDRQSTNPFYWGAFVAVGGRK
jgi:CHAT domain-containing protein/Tfp pilus assembly protein PilF